MNFQSKGKETILLVEDEASVRLITHRFLQRLGYTVLEAAHAKEALQKYYQFQGRIDLLITDVVMPNMSGPELAEMLTQKQPELKILYVSGYADNILDDYIAQGSDINLLEKPFTLDVLGRKIQGILDNS